MPRPKGSKKDKNQSNKVLLTSSLSHTSTSSPLPPSQPSVLLPNLICFNDDMRWIETPVNSPIVNKGGRPKKAIDDSLVMTNSPISSSSELRTNELNGSRVVVNPAVLRYLEQNRNTNYSSVLTKDSITNKNEIDEFLDGNIPMDINEGKDNNNNSFDDLLKSFAEQDSILKKDILIDSTTEKPLSTPSTAVFSNQRRVSANEFIELDKLIQDDLFWDFCTCSTDFITSARLAEWILTHQQSAKLEPISLTNC
jgi:hypothetical protein